MDDVLDAVRAGDLRRTEVVLDEVRARLIRLRSVGDVLPAGLYAVDADGRIVYANPAAASLLGREIEELVGSPESDVFPGGGTGERVAASERAVEREEAFPRADGSTFRAVVVAAPLPHADGRPGAVVFFRDATESARAREDLRRREEEWRRFVEASPAPIAVHAGGRILYANDAVARLLRLPSGRAVGRDVMDFVHPDSRALVADRMRRSAVPGASLPAVEEHLVRADGTEFWAEVAATAVTYEGRPAVMLAVRDVTPHRLRAEEQARAADELRRLVEERTRALEAANRELEAFSYTVSHDLRAPLRGIEYLTSVLLEDLGDEIGPEAKPYLERLAVESRRLTDLVNALLTLSRTTRGEFRRERVDLTAMAHDVVAELRAADPTRRVEVDVRAGLEADADPRLLRAVLENLLGNAWKFTSRTPGARIVVGAREVDGTTEYFVRDNGAGFDPARAGELFTPFRRLHTEREFHGTGIGLATVRRIVERHGGRIRAEGRPGGGATFAFTLCPPP